MLEGMLKAMEDYLETKRLAFPRFYFLSTPELVTLLTNCKDHNAVQVPPPASCHPRSWDSCRLQAARPDPHCSPWRAAAVVCPATRASLGARLGASRLQQAAGR